MALRINHAAARITWGLACRSGNSGSNRRLPLRGACIRPSTAQSDGFARSKRLDRNLRIAKGWIDKAADLSRSNRINDTEFREGHSGSIPKWSLVIHPDAEEPVLLPAFAN